MFQNYIDLFSKLSRVAAIVIIVFMSPAMAAPALQNDGKSPVRFSLVRTFSLPNVPVSQFQSELFQKQNGSAVLADIVDLNLQFAAEHGKPTPMQPQFAPETHIMILVFPDRWWTINMIRANGQGAFICRIKARMVEPRPERADFDKYFDWCRGVLAAGTLDPSILGEQ